MGAKCPVCGAVSELSYKCDECGKPFDGDGDSAPGRAQEGR